MELFLSMQEWKIVNAFHVRVRRKNQVKVKMSLQLYQVDYKSYLLDFKSLPSNEDELSKEGSGGSTSSDPFSTTTFTQCHHIMEFFEMCAALITQLAR